MALLDAREPNPAHWVLPPLVTSLGVCLVFLDWQGGSLLAQPALADDAFMFVRYADHFLAGHGLSWNPGEGPVYGISSLAHQLVVTAARALLPWSTDQILVFSSCTAGIAGLSLLIHLCWKDAEGISSNLSSSAG